MAKSVYIHVPFCEGRCSYCTFYSGEDTSFLEEYPRLLLMEAGLLQSSGEFDREAETLYLGGGTPGLLGERGISETISGLGRFVRFLPDAEITAETKPAVTRDFEGLKRSGVRRLSLGVQALDDGLLKKLGRKHDSKEALKAVGSALSAGLELSCDLMYGYRGLEPETLSGWAARLAEMGVGHVSAYSLEMPKLRPQRGALRLAGIKSDPRAEESQWKALFDTLAGKGLLCYEVSNFALPGKESRHNKNYWDQMSYAGLGPGAHSYSREASAYGTRRWNECSLEKYRSALLSGSLPPHKPETLSRREALLESLFLSLRQKKPLEPATISTRFGLEESLLLSLLETLAENGDLETTLTPTPKGMRRADGLSMWLLDRMF